MTHTRTLYIPAISSCTARITEKINESASENFKVSSRSVGRTCSASGLGHKKTSQHRLIVIPQRKMDEFKSTIKNATNATNVTSSQKSIVSEDVNNNINATNVTAEDGISGINNPNDTVVNRHQLTFDGIYGINGVLSEKERKLNTSKRPDEVEI